MNETLFAQLWDLRLSLLSLIRKGHVHPAEFSWAKNTDSFLLMVQVFMEYERCAFESSAPLSNLAELSDVFRIYCWADTQSLSLQTDSRSHKPCIPT